MFVNYSSTKLGKNRGEKECSKFLSILFLCLPAEHHSEEMSIYHGFKGTSERIFHHHLQNFLVL